jgi:hypothetical protein
MISARGFGKVEMMIEPGKSPTAILNGFMDLRIELDMEFVRLITWIFRVT